MPFLQGKILGGGGGHFSHPVHRIPFMWRSEDNFQELALSSHHGVLGIKLRWLALAAGKTLLLCYRSMLLEI